LIIAPFWNRCIAVGAVNIGATAHPSETDARS
jgi:hypothetical protein